MLGSEQRAAPGEPRAAGPEPPPAHPDGTGDDPAVPAGATRQAGVAAGPAPGGGALESPHVSPDASRLEPGTHLGYSWARTPLVAALRRVLQSLFAPLFHLLYAVDIEPRALLATLPERVIFVANHHHHLDGALIVASLPPARRRRLVVVAAADTIFASPLRGAIAALLGNAVPLERAGGARLSLEHLAEVVEDGSALLIFPEGRLTVGGPLRPLKGGTAVLALETGAPVVPMWLSVTRPGLWEGRRRRGHMRLRLGEPLTLAEPADHAAAAAQLRAALLALTA